MKYLATIKSAEGKFGPPPAALMAAIDAFAGEAQRAGVLVEAGGLMGTSHGVRVRVAGGRITVTDGPFSEAKEIVGGYAFYKVASKEEALRWTERFMDLHREHWKAWEGECELRQIEEWDGPPPAA